MGKYIKKPVAIEAIEWTGENIDEVMDFIDWRHGDYDKRYGLIIYTLEGDHIASKGDFIIKGVAGEFYPCKPDIFRSTYYTEQEYAEI